jgi:nitric oxide reductase subunit B
MALLFLMQTLLGGAGEHYRAELSNFFGFDLARVLPFNIARTWHLQLAIFWVATSYLAAGIFLVPMITGREPRGQGVLSYLLLGAGGGCVWQHGRRICGRLRLDSEWVVVVRPSGFYVS